MSKVSIIIPIRNNWEFTKQCIRSIIMNTEHKDYEIIIIDNNSTDRTKDELQNYLKGFIDLKALKTAKIIHNAENRNFSVSNNEGRANSSGEYLCFLGYYIIETKLGTKFIRDIKIGELVKTHLGKFRKVKRIFKRKYKGPLIQIVLNYGDNKKYGSIKCTPGHPFLVNRGTYRKWVKAKDIILTDKLLYPCKKKRDYLIFNCYGRGTRGLKNNNKDNKFGPYKNEYFGKYKVDKNLARFLGLYLAEGCRQNDGIRFTFNQKEVEYIKFIERVCIEKFNRKPTISHVKKDSVTGVKLNIKSFSTLFTKWFGENADKKRIPKFIFNWSLPNKLAFIEGYIEGDGTNHGNGKTVSTSSKKLIDGLKKICQESGIGINKIREFPVKISVIRNCHVLSKRSFRITINKQDWIKLMCLSHSPYKEGYLEVVVKDIKRKKSQSLLKEGQQYVYNLEVEKDYSYIVNSVIVHNCLLNNDTLVTKGWLTAMLRVFEEEKDVGIVGARLVFPGTGLIQHAGIIFMADGSTDHAHYRVHQDSPLVLQRKGYPAVTGACLLIPTKLYDSVGGLDERYFWGWEDVVLCNLIRKEGYKIIYEPNAIVYHYCSQTFGRYDFESQNFNLYVKEWILNGDKRELKN